MEYRQLKRIIKAIEKQGNITVACKKLGISRGSVNYHLGKLSDSDELVLRFKAIANRKIEGRPRKYVNFRDSSRARQKKYRDKIRQKTA